MVLAPNPRYSRPNKDLVLTQPYLGLRSRRRSRRSFRKGQGLPPLGFAFSAGNSETESTYRIPGPGNVMAKRALGSVSVTQNLAVKLDQDCPTPEIVALE